MSDNHDDGARAAHEEVWRKGFNESEQAMIRYLVHMPSPVSIDTLGAVCRTSSLRALNTMEKLRNKRLVRARRGYDKGLYFVDPVFSSRVIKEQTLRREAQSIVEELIRFYVRTVSAGNQRTLALAELHLKIENSTEDGLTWMWRAANALEESGEEEKALVYYRFIRKHFRNITPTGENIAIFLESALKDLASTSEPIPAVDKAAVLMNAGEAAKLYGKWDYFARIALERCADFMVAGQNAKLAHYVDALKKVAARTDDPRIHRSIALSMAEVHFHRGLLSKAMASYERTIGDLEEFGDNEEVLKVTALIGWCYVMCGRAARGMGMVEGTRTKSRLLKLRKAGLVADVMSIQALLEMRKTKEAEATLNNCSAWRYPASNFEHFMAWHIERAKGYVLYAKGDYEKAFESQRKATRQLRSLGWMPKHTSWSLECLRGLEARGLRDEDMAYEEEVERLARGDDIYLRGFALRLRGEGAMEKGRLNEDVLSDLIKSRKCLVLAGAEIESARTQIALGKYYLKKGRRRTARTHLSKAWRFFSALDKGLFPTDLIAVLPPEHKTELMMNKVVDINESLGSVRDASSFLLRVLDLAMGLTLAMRGGFVALESGEPKMIASRNMDPMFLSRKGSGRIGKVMLDAFHVGTEMVVPGPDGENKALLEAFHEAGIDLLICTPARLGKQIYGYLCLDSPMDGGPFSVEALPFVRVLCSQIAVGLSNIATYREMKELKDRYEEEASFYKQEMGVAAPLETIIGESEAIVRLKKQIGRVASTDSSVLVSGETGVGKELVAKAIHNLSKRKHSPFIPVNLTALPQELVASELFGHEKGAFTGAGERRKGRFELADGGAIFFDEIGDLPQNAQVKLLRVLQEGTFERLGSAVPIRSDFRVIAATNKNLRKEVEKGSFREDLFYRLNAFPIFVPPLRERKEDISLLAHYFIDKHSRKLGKRIKRAPSDEIKKLFDYDWPGNVRELEHFLERAVILSDGGEVSLSGLEQGPADENRRGAGARPMSLADMEKKYIREILRKQKWKIYGRDGAAAVLGLKPSTLQSRMKKLGIAR